MRSAPDVQQGQQEIAPKNSGQLLEVHRRGRGVRPFLRLYMHCCFAMVIVAAITHVYLKLADPIPNRAFELMHPHRQVVTIVWIGGEAFGAD